MRVCGPREALVGHLLGPSNARRPRASLGSQSHGIDKRHRRLANVSSRGRRDLVHRVTWRDYRVITAAVEVTVAAHRDQSQTRIASRVTDGGITMYA